MTATDRDPATIAREVLDMAHEDDTITVCTIPDNKAAALARAVIRLADLADDLDEDAVYVRNAFNGIEGRRRAEERRSAAARIRTALNGETHD
ncbi:hypothetical protein QP858_07965 [Trueperella bernardiae]|uniref:Uncharacterized protein n=1 Tax=Trueperella bernardiae TaxID=59561 RepID=A0AAW6ZIY8_9ACTO|nr:hypothetical protein [Micrococcus luteus]MDK8526509.1 hypothetical protein [Micrococcus luteus]MDK8602389.1 hypothetical protein [Trueperella bernardiae]